MASCIVKFCKNTFRNCKKSEKKVQFYRIPKEDGIRRKWLDLCGIAEVTTKDPRVCSAHFQEDDIGTETARNIPTLNLTAVPVLKLGIYYALYVLALT